MTALRPLLTATAAGGLLAALWFVPSANATVETPQAQGAQTQGTRAAERQKPTQAQQAAHGPNAAAPDKAAPAKPGKDAALALADTGSVDTTPYLIGGTAFLGIGAGFVTYSVRRRGALPV
ncbi:hypothetical protein GCM10010329_03850 [Streptomyces spiroverticillatus]|uniref:LPXTG cell wall anchor domain-containing protein n=1 Tax=Streptomyces finlayi TaxID=67296 RepID=A0A918WSH2_9ACTN|nr:hypothetical protein [Streptomyces finlayi]GGZ87160.1 hypothetical protein GCM10010329_03850 [Streptomyces spiroverticillatus]GHC78489.1 hypothetical protein GCM10010334_03830 [Streptomyces finlayi]